ncbi:MAG: hypothetical protein K8W52_24185 [Deltaproteobacteria bacterium]|nr:hypothetical protein [Deltaproteobacteria bacterium]
MRGSSLLVLVIAAGVVYHLAQKSSTASSPWATLAVAYGVGFAIALVLAALASAPPSGREWRAGVAIGLAALGIEAGFFLLYRSGWPLASASVIASIAVTAALAVIGVAWFGEVLTARRAIGIGLAAIAGVVMTTGQG